MNSIIHGGEANKPLTAAEALKMQKDYSQSNRLADTLQEWFDKQHKDSSAITIPKFSSILMEMQELYEKKNHDYGNSFSETIQEFGFTPAIARINDKLKRLKQMVKGGQMQVDESMRDNLIDIANYCVLTIIEIDNQNK